MNSNEVAIQQCREIVNKWYLLQLYENPEEANKFFTYWSNCELEMQKLQESYKEPHESDN